VAATLTDPLLGQLIDGRYEVLSRIARGGMATVYLANDRRLDREVAVKGMHQHLAEGASGADFVARFRREARAAARLTHPGLVGVLDQGVDGDVSYLIMEYVDGPTLRRHLDERGSLTVGEALQVTEAVLDALSAAHRTGLVHRDIKPENVLIDADDRVRITDFGLARAVTEVTSTTTGTVLGTVGYLAPELVTHGVCDPRTDVYAAGILLYEMLTGAQPFTGATPIQVAYQHVNQDVPAVSDVIGWLPVEIDELVGALAARDPQDRPLDAVAALAHLRRVQRDLDPELLARRADVAPRVPAAVGAIAAATAAGVLLQLPVETSGSRFGGIPGGFPVPSVPAFSWTLMRELLPEAFAIAFLISIETLLSAVVGDGMTGERHDSDMELVAQGCANAVSAFFGGVPSTAALARTAANIKGGARSPVSGMVHSLPLVLFIAALAPLASHVPLASLAAVLMLVAWDMSDLDRVVRLLKGAPRSDSLTLLTTLGLSLGVGITVAVEVGVALAAFLFLKRMIEVSNVKMEGDAQGSAIPQHSDAVEVFEITGPFFFGVADVLQETLEQVEKEPKAYVLRMRDVPAVDATGINALEAFLHKARKLGTALFLSEVREQPLAAFERSGFLDEIGRDHVAGTIEEALALAERAAKSPARPAKSG